MPQVGAEVVELLIPENVRVYINESSIRCFVNLCNAMYKPNCPLQGYSRLELTGALIISIALSANGIMVLIKHLLEDLRHKDDKVVYAENLRN